MTNLVFDLINQFGYLAISLLIAIENIFPPIPSEVILSFAGFATHHSQMNVFGVIIASTIGAVVGALVLYWIGTLLNPDRLEKLFDHKLFKLLGFKKGDVQKAIRWFDKYGTGAIFYGRCIPVVRSLISIPAGIAKVKLPKFLIYTSLGSLLWNAILVGRLAFITPVTTSAEGLCVAIIKCIPTALLIPAKRDIKSSTSFEATTIKL